MFREGVSSLSSTSSSFLKTLQQELKEAGFDPGPVNGQTESATLRALKQFQETQGLSANGELDIPTLTKLVEKNLPR